ncbi:MAG: hypothetical protein QXD77_03320, partial [Candidatus Aenigmatarchaeota archaeon]
MSRAFSLRKKAAAKFDKERYCAFCSALDLLEGVRKPKKFYAKEWAELRTFKRKLGPETAERINAALGYMWHMKYSLARAAKEARTTPGTVRRHAKGLRKGKNGKWELKKKPKTAPLPNRAEEIRIEEPEKPLMRKFSSSGTAMALCVKSKSKFLVAVPIKDAVYAKSAKKARETLKKIIKIRMPEENPDCI